MTYNYSEITMSQHFENATNDSISNNGRDEKLAKIEISTLGVLLYFIIFGNVFVLFVLKFKYNSMTRMQWFIFHLCLADLSVGAFNLLPQMIWDITYRFQGNDLLCKFVKYFQLVAMYGSSYVLVTTAIDRYASICYPISSQTWTNKRIHCMISLAWILSLLFSIPQTVIFSYRETIPGSGVFDCWETLSSGPLWKLQAYITWIFISIYFIPFCILTYTYSRICYVVWISIGSSSKLHTTTAYPRTWKISFSKAYSVREERHENSIKKPRVHRKSVSNSKLKTIKLTVAVILCYLLCWGPFFIAQMWLAFDMNAPFNHAAMVVILLLTGLNSCVNPWLFLAFSGRMCTKTKQSSRQYTCTTGTDSDGRHRSPSLYDGNSSIIKIGSIRNGNNIVRNSRF